MIPARDLRNHTNDVLKRVASGEDITITSNGVPVAELRHLHPGKRASMTWQEFLDMPKADPGLRDDLAWISGETTDDLGPIR